MTIKKRIVLNFQNRGQHECNDKKDGVRSLYATLFHSNKLHNDIVKCSFSCAIERDEKNVFFS
jgi:hypothetical protein